MRAADARSDLIALIDSTNDEDRRAALIELDSAAFEVPHEGCYWLDGWDADRLAAAVERTR